MYFSKLQVAPSFLLTISCMPSESLWSLATRGIPSLGIQGMSQIPGPDRCVSFILLCSPFFFILCFTLVVVSSSNVKSFFYKPILFYLHRLTKKCKLPFVFAVCGDPCPWKRESSQLSESNTLLWPPDSGKREVHIGLVCNSKPCHWLGIKQVANH